MIWQVFVVLFFQNLSGLSALVPLDTCTDQSWFSSFNPLENNSIVTLPSHSSIPVQFHGDVRLSDELTLRDVLYVLDFKLNLLSVSVLAVHSNLAILLIQDISSQIMIGKGRRIHDLYVLQAATTSSPTVVTIYGPPLMAKIAVLTRSFEIF